jgi:predicted tellurium resistance membrane protein TerC
MSVDNVIGVTGAACDSLVLLGIGMAVSIQVIVWSSQLIMKSMERFPVIVMLGAGLLGWVAGGMIVGDPLLHAWLMNQPGWVRPVAGLLGMGIVLGLARVFGRRASADAGRRIL